MPEYGIMNAEFCILQNESFRFPPRLRRGCEIESNHKNALAGKHFYLCYNRIK